MNKFFLLGLAVFFCWSNAFAQCENFEMWISEWKKPKYQDAKTYANYLNEEERNFYYFLNLLRQNPSLFAETFLDKCTEWNGKNELGYVVMFGSEIQKLSKSLKKMSALPIIRPTKNESLLTSCYNQKKSCNELRSGGSSSAMYYENTGMRLLMSILKSSNSVARKRILSPEPKPFGISILMSPLQKGKTTSQITLFETPVQDTKAYADNYQNPQSNKPVYEANSLLNLSVKAKEFQTSVPEWKNERYLAANTAATTEYLNEQEKLVYYFLNLARMNPSLFADTFLKKYTAWNANKFEDLSNDNYYYRTLYKTLKEMKPVGILYPQKRLYESAACHAISSGKKGYVGHKRIVGSGCKPVFAGECCSYGVSDALGIVMQLLIDDGVESLGHREICLSDSFKTLGVSIYPHKTYRFNAVLDFGR